MHNMSYRVSNNKTRLSIEVFPPHSKTITTIKFFFKDDCSDDIFHAQFSFKNSSLHSFESEGNTLIYLDYILSSIEICGVTD